VRWIPGVRIVNNPVWWSADDKFFDNLVAKSVNVAVPRTVLLPHKLSAEHRGEVVPEYEVGNWDEVSDYPSSRFS
jgi:hypothetical protein